MAVARSVPTVDLPTPAMPMRVTQPPRGQARLVVGVVGEVIAGHGAGTYTEMQPRGKQKRIPATRPDGLRGVRPRGPDRGTPGKRGRFANPAWSPDIFFETRRMPPPALPMVPEVERGERPGNGTRKKGGPAAKRTRLESKAREGLTLGVLEPGAGAARWPYFLRSFLRGSRVRKPAPLEGRGAGPGRTRTGRGRCRVRTRGRLAADAAAADVDLDVELARGLGHHQGLADDHLQRGARGSTLPWAGC